MTTANGTAARVLPKMRVPSAYHRLHTLLHTMRCIREREDALCEMMHELKNSNSVSEEQANELRGILEDLPSQDYLDDLRSITDLLGEPPRKKGSEPKRVARPVANQSGSVSGMDSPAKSVHKKASRRNSLRSQSGPRAEDAPRVAYCPARDAVLNRVAIEDVLQP